MVYMRDELHIRDTRHVLALVMKLHGRYLASHSTDFLHVACWYMHPSLLMWTKLVLSA